MNPGVQIEFIWQVNKHSFLQEEKQTRIQKQHILE